MKKIKRDNISELNKKLDKLLGLQKKEIAKESSIERLEKEELKHAVKEEKYLKGLDKEESQVINEIEILENVEKKIKKEISQHPLKKISFRDAGKAMVGAFVGLLSHFAVLEGVKFAEEVTIRRATFLYIVSLFLAFIVLYYTGFRKIKDPKLLFLLPVRLFLIYGVTIITILFVLLIIGKLDGLDFMGVYKTVSVLLMPGIIGAAVADLIGGE